MKRFTKMLAMGLAVALTLGMTVSAAWSPDTTTAGVEPSKEVVVDETPIAKDVWAAADAVVESGKLSGFNGAGKAISYLTVKVVDLKAAKNGQVTFTLNTGYEWSDEEYGTTWGYVLLHFPDEDDLTKFERFGMTKSGDKYTANVPKGGSPYAVVLWKLAYSAKEDGFIGGIKGPDGTNPSWRPLEDQRNNTKKYLYDGEANRVAQSFNGLYEFVDTMGVAEMYLKEDSYVYFTLDHVDGENKYIAILYTINDDGSINYNSYTSMVLQEDVVGKYSATLPAGQWHVAVIKVAINAGLVPPTPPVEPVEAEAPAAAAPISAGAGTPAAGVVSPKTGEMLPVAVILAAICLAGAAVCAKKARTNA